MNEQTKRGPGRPRQYTGRQRTSLELSSDVLKAVDERRGDESRAAYIDRVLRKALDL